MSLSFCFVSLYLFNGTALAAQQSSSSPAPTTYLTTKEASAALLVSPSTAPTVASSSAAKVPSSTPPSQTASTAKPNRLNTPNNSANTNSLVVTTDAVSEQNATDDSDIEEIDAFEIEGMSDNQDLLAKPNSSVELIGPPPPLDLPYDRDIWQRIRNGFAMPELDDPRVKVQTNFYGQYPKFVAKVAERAGQYLFYILEELEKRNMPTELALLPFVESSFNPEAVSVAKAAGMWQFIPSTGKFYGLDQNLFYDERRDVRASTQAALDYLQRLHDQFGDWFLALASYNWGENAVARAQAKNLRDGKPTDYLSLNMPNETRNYVPRLLAIKALIANPELYQIQLPPVANEPHFIAVYINRDIDVDRAAKLADISVAEFRSLNPSFRKPLIIASAKNPILIPEEKADLFVQNLEKEQGALSSWSIYTLSAKETLAQVAARFDVNLALLSSINNISTKAKIHAGSTLLVPRGKTPPKDISQTVIQNARVVLESAPKPSKKPTKKAHKTKLASRSKTGAKTTIKPSGTTRTHSKTSSSKTSDKKLAAKNAATKKSSSDQKSKATSTTNGKKNSQTSTKKDSKK